MGLFNFLKSKNDIHDANLFYNLDLAKKYIELLAPSKLSKSGIEELKNNLVLSGMNDDEAHAAMLYSVNDFDNAVNIYSQLSNLQPKSMYMLGTCYLYGRGTTKDTYKAFELLKLASVNQCADAMFFLSICFEQGVGTTVDLKKASEWEKKALDLNVPRAFFYRAIKHHTGIGAQKDINLTFKSLQKADMDLAYYSLGYMYKHGLGTDINHKKAFELFKKSSECWDIRGILELVNYYVNGLAGTRDLDKAIYWETVLYNISKDETEMDTDKFRRTLEKIISMK